MKDIHPEAIDESTESELTFLPDGRVYAFGITRELVAVLATLPTSDPRMREQLARLAGQGSSTNPEVEATER